MDKPPDSKLDWCGKCLVADGAARIAGLFGLSQPISSANFLVDVSANDTVTLAD